MRLKEALLKGLKSIDLYFENDTEGGGMMTRQEAINYLHLLEQNVLLGEKITEAVHMAIKALEQEERLMNELLLSAIVSILLSKESERLGLISTAEHKTNIDIIRTVMGGTLGVDCANAEKEGE